MNNKTITPSFQQPVDRIASGQLPSALAELSAGSGRRPSRGDPANRATWRDFSARSSQP